MTPTDRVTSRLPESAGDSLLREGEDARVRPESADRTIARARFLLEMSEVLDRSRDLGEMATQVARLAVPRLADWCAVDLLAPGGGVERVAIVHRDPARLEAAQRLRERYPPRLDRDAGIATVLRTGEPAHEGDVTPEALAAAAHGAEHLELLRALGVRSFVIAPLTAHGRTIGALSVFTAESGRRYDPEDVALVVAAARHAGMAIERARLHEDVSRARVQLAEQRAALDRQATQLAEAASALERANAERAANDHHLMATAAELRRTVVQLAERETQVSGSDRQFRTLADMMPQLVWATNPEGYHEYFNERWYAYTGMPRPGELGGERDRPQGWDWVSYLHPDDVERAAATWEHSLQTGAPYAIEYRFREAATGDYRWFVGRAVAQRDEAGRIIRWFGTCTDIHDQKIAEWERDQLYLRERQAREAAEAANAAKGEFLATMSHELRTPLNAIGGYADLLEMGVRGTLPAAAMDDVGRIKRSQRHLLSLVNDILNFARLQGRRVEAQLAPVRVHGVMAEVEPLVTGQFELRGIDFAYSQCDPALCAIADPEKLRQVLLNLLSNAMKFTAPGGRVAVECQPDGNRVRLTVADTGRGIPEDRLQTIFEPFVQIDRHLTDAPLQGVGLGLSICHDLVQLMRGALHVESEEGKGSRFTVELERG